MDANLAERLRAIFIDELETHVRTLSEGVSLSVIQYDAGGVPSTFTVRRSYPANYFEQMTVSQFLDGNAIAPGGYLLVQIDTGSAFFYATVTDNRTNDSSIRFPVSY